jgi:dUTP pyrophosphatase
MKRKQIVVTNPDLITNDWLPKYATSGSAAFELRAMFDKDKYGEVLSIHANERVLIPSGLKISVADETIAGVILPRSGYGHKGLICGNTIGLIDSDYLGELFISAWNRTDEVINIPYGERIVQMIFVKVERYELDIVNEFNVDSERGENGFGHSGTK